MFFLNALAVSLIVGVFVVVAEGAAPWLNKRYSARWRCWVWLILAFWLVVPVMLPVSWAPLTFTVPDTVVVRLVGNSEDDFRYAGGGDSVIADNNELAGSAGAAGNDPVGSDPVGSDPIGSDLVGAGSAAGNVHDPAASRGLNEAAGVQTSSDAASPAALTGDPFSAALHVTVLDILIMLWLLGFASFLAVRWVVSLRFRLLLRRVWRPCDNVEVARFVRRTMADMDFHADINIKICRGIQSPFVMGLFHPILVLPERQYDLRLLAHVICHELTHCKRRDLWYKLVMDVANALHWFNPLVWLMNRAGSRDLELVCDELVVRGQDGSRRREYGESILLIVKPMKNRRLPALTTAFMGGLEDLKRRLENIMRTGTNTKGRGGVFPVLTVLLAVLVSGAFQVNVAASGATERESFAVTYNYEANGGDSATATAMTVGAGEPVDLTPTAEKAGWEFLGWNTDAVAVAGLTTCIMPASNMTLYAVFRLSGGDDVKTESLDTVHEDALGELYQPSNQQSIKILSIGSSWGDGMDYRLNAGGGHLFQLLREAGYREITLGVLDAAAPTLQAHWNNVSANNLGYAWHKFDSKNSSDWGTTLYKYNVTMQYGIEHEDWDIIILLQPNIYPHDAKAYDPYLNDLIQYIKDHQTNPKARLGWQMTWANGLKEDVPGGGGYLVANEAAQLVMFDNIKSAVRDWVADNPGIDFIIPSGSVVQEMRGLVPGSRLILNNYSQLSYDLGRYAVSMTWIRAITDKSVNNRSYRPEGVSEAEQNAVKKAVNKAFVSMR
ncbi:MAG: DUF4886 domain-containing protein, partial [Gracilibacteraceae bacterium]|jgi:beta-lactamase regulating signal transducer with metallopeptidase domain|nr:DUF4886 domain-containing protein [Gracilibacteraceae bacterium]